MERWTGVESRVWAKIIRRMRWGIWVAEILTVKFEMPSTHWSGDTDRAFGITGDRNSDGF